MMLSFSPRLARAREVPTPVAPETPDPREPLRQAQATAAEACAAVESAAQAAARGQVEVDRCRAVLAAHDALDARVAAHNAGLLRAGDTAGRTALPADLVEARRAQAEAREDLADATAAHALLAGEARAAAAAAEQADAAVRAAADAVAVAAVFALVVELKERELAASRLRGLVTGFLATRSSVDGPLPWPVQEIVHHAHHGVLLDVARVDLAAISGAWVAFRRELASDPDALLEAAP